MSTSKILTIKLLLANGLGMTTSDVQRAIYDCLVGYIPKSCTRFQVLTQVRKLQEGKLFTLYLIGNFRKEYLTLHPPSNEAKTVNVNSNSEKEDANPLTPRETEVLMLVAKGLQNMRIADMLKISDGTVRTHINNIMDKMDVRTRIEIVVKSLSLGWITINNLSDEKYGLANN